MRRALLATVGGLVLAAGVVLTGDGSTGLLEPVVRALGNDYLLVATLGGVAAVVAAAAVVSGRSATLEQAEVPDPELPVSVPAAGDGFDERVDDWRFRAPVVGADRREAVRRRLRRAAVGVVQRTDGCPRERARDRVESGDWTDDDAAAAFLAEAESGVVGTVFAPSRARRAAAAIVDRDDGTGRDAERGEPRD